ncbi:MAG TPA: hypothetical protein DD415_06775 [Clostridiales bacterium]|nr:hypothetical protein [Clostridiales bacterium]
MSVLNLKAGECARIVRVNATGGVAARLNSLGITAGKRISVLAFSLFKTGILLGCGAVRVGIRKSLAAEIEVEKCA